MTQDPRKRDLAQATIRGSSGEAVAENQGPSEGSKCGKAPAAKDSSERPDAIRPSQQGSILDTL
jgi:hypothetical protein